MFCVYNVWLSYNSFWDVSDGRVTSCHSRLSHRTRRFVSVGANLHLLQEQTIFYQVLEASYMCANIILYLLCLSLFYFPQYIQGLSRLPCIFIASNHQINFTSIFLPSFSHMFPSLCIFFDYHILFFFSPSNLFSIHPVLIFSLKLIWVEAALLPVRIDCSHMRPCIVHLINQPPCNMKRQRLASAEMGPAATQAHRNQQGQEFWKWTV